MAIAGSFKRGENQLIDLPLVQSDGTTPLLVSALLGAQAELIQRGRVLYTYVMGTDPELTESDTATNYLLLHIKIAVSLSLAISPLTIKWTITVTDADYIDGHQLDLPCTELLVYEC